MNKAILNNPSFSTTSDVKAICDEYFGDLNLNLHYFGHGAVYKDGRHHFLLSNPEWGKAHLLEEQLPPAGYTVFDEVKNSIMLPHINSEDGMGWSGEGMKLAKDRFGIENLMVIYHKYGDQIQNFFFDLHDEKAQEIFINHFDIFENFIFYFKDKARGLLDLASKNPLRVSEELLNSEITVSKKDQTEILVHQNNHLIPKQYCLRNNGINYYISTREYQCLSSIAHGGKIKDIAQTLNISPRTIDTHLISLKRKLRTKTLAEAVQIYWKNRIGGRFA